jgi:cytochrome P450
MATVGPSAAAALPPGPRAPALLQTIRLVTSPYGWPAACRRRWGDTFTARSVGQPPSVVFSHPDAIRDVFTADSETIASGGVMEPMLGPVLGRNSLLLLDGARHQRERRLMAPPFHGERMHAYGATIQAITDRAVDTWPGGQPFPIHATMQAITFDVIVRAVLGLEDGPELERIRAPLLHLLALANGPGAPLIAMLPVRIDLGPRSPWGGFLRTRAAFREVLVGEIRRRRASAAARADILSLLLDARDEDGGAMTEDELFDEMFTLLMAGHETTASSLAWVLGHVLARPEALARLRAELRDAGHGGPVAPRDVVALEYLDAVVKESARLTPVATGVLRLVRRPVRIGGVALPAGVTVSPSISLVHHRADVWPEPERFDPDRFLGARPSPFTFFPFGGGERRCLGAAFATWETKLVLARVLERADLRLAPGYRMQPRMRAVTVSPSRGVPVVLDRRR